MQTLSEYESCKFFIKLSNATWFLEIEVCIKIIIDLNTSMLTSYCDCNHDSIPISNIAKHECCISIQKFADATPITTPITIIMRKQ